MAKPFIQDVLFDKSELLDLQPKRADTSLFHLSIHAKRISDVIRHTPLERISRHRKTDTEKHTSALLKQLKQHK